MRNLNQYAITLLVPLFIVAGCQYGGEGTSDFSSGEGTGGSMARFTITGDHLYTVDHNTLKVFHLTDPRKPIYKGQHRVGIDVETIFPQGTNLFLGTSTGMYIFDITSPEAPEKVSFYEHVYSCDPVVSDGQYAYVTLSSSNQRCWRAVNELQIIDIQDKTNLKKVNQVSLTSPRGLAIRRDTLWVCDEGLRVFDVKNKEKISEIAHFTGFPAYDIILHGRLALVTGEEGLVQYLLENDTIRKISEIRLIP